MISMCYMAVKVKHGNTYYSLWQVCLLLTHLNEVHTCLEDCDQCRTVQLDEAPIPVVSIADMDFGAISNTNKRSRAGHTNEELPRKVSFQDTFEQVSKDCG